MCLVEQTAGMLVASLFVLESMKAGVVSNHVDLHQLLLGWCLLAVMRCLGKIPASCEAVPRRYHFSIPLMLGILGVFILLIKLRGLEVLGLAGALAGGIAAGALVYLIYDDSSLDCVGKPVGEKVEC